MRTLLIAALMLVASSASAQLAKMYNWQSRPTTTWTKYYKTVSPKILFLEVSIDTTTATGDVDTLIVAFNADTTATNYFRLFATDKGGEVKLWSPIYIDTVRIRTVSGTLPIRVEIH
jgi:hypothetical protein